MSRLHEFFESNIPAVLIDPDGRQHLGLRNHLVLLSGSFNPLHSGHLGMAAAASRILQKPITFEITICNVDKSALSFCETQDRLRQFAWRHPVWITRAATFVDKAAIFPDAVFIVGADTAERIVDPSYYCGKERDMILALDKIQSRGCRFLVASRHNAGGQLIGRHHLSVPESHGNLFGEIPRSEFEEKISSTQLRRQICDTNG